MNYIFHLYFSSSDKEVVKFLIQTIYLQNHVGKYVKVALIITVFWVKFN
jgi:hypothetical protein